ncbi:hypothetical protein [Nocardiopsis baichengensis]|uniref:hypothetical protein n=1 Tax=Nocardiopsis baichengensis TaxID=280240 RepID=UPI000346582F|nr:hypothetical protein [Nocardiopsis baichengensis]
MITNEAMDRLLMDMGPVDDDPLPGPLRKVADAPWGRGPTGVLSPGGAPPDWTSEEPDTGPEGLMDTELEVNDFRIDDEDLVEDPSSYLQAALSRGLRFAALCLRNAGALPEAPDLRAVVATAVDEDFLVSGTTVRFFLLRDALPGRYQNLARFTLEAMAVMDPKDAERIVG